MWGLLKFSHIKIKNDESFTHVLFGRNRIVRTNQPYFNLPPDLSCFSFSNSPSLSFPPLDLLRKLQISGFERA